MQSNKLVRLFLQIVVCVPIYPRLGSMPSVEFGALCIILLLSLYRMLFSHLCDIEGLNIRRKTRISHSKTIWWFVIHCDESLLCELDSKCAVVNMQTCWDLKIFSNPVDMAPNPFCFAEPTPLVQSTFEIFEVFFCVSKRFGHLI